MTPPLDILNGIEEEEKAVQEIMEKLKKCP